MSNGRNLTGPVGFSHIEYWIFDLDNTLYASSSNIFKQINENINLFVRDFLKVGREEADIIKNRYRTTYGTTLSGLMAEHGLEPSQYLEVIHDIDHSELEENPPLRAAIANLPGRKYVLTNGSYKHAQQVSDKLGIGDVFTEIYDIEALDFQSKPGAGAYERFFTRTGAPRARSAMFEDLAQNLQVPHEMGLTTTLVVAPGDDRGQSGLNGGAKPDHVHHVTDDLAGFLAAVTTRHFPSP